MPTPTQNAATVTKVQLASNVLTQAVTIAAGADRCFTCRLNFFDGTLDPYTVTYGGVALTLGGETVLDGDTARASVWYLLAPPTGAANLVVTLAVAHTAGIKVILDQWAGVDQTTPFGAWAPFTSIGFEARPSWNVNVATAVDDLVLDAYGLANGVSGTESFGAGQTSDGAINDGQDDLLASHKTATTTTTNVSVASTVDAIGWGGGIAMKGSSSGPLSPVRFNNQRTRPAPFRPGLAR